MDYDELVQRLRVWSLDERRGDGMLLVRTSNAIVALQARVAELEHTNSARVDQAERERDAAIAVVDTNWVTHQQIVAVRAERDALARQLAISRALLMECAQNLSPPWQNPDHPLWSLKARINATFAGQQS